MEKADCIIYHVLEASVYTIFSKHKQQLSTLFSAIAFALIPHSISDFCPQMSSFFGGKDPFDHPFFTQPLKSFFDDTFFASPFHDQTGSGKPITIEELDPVNGDVISSNSTREVAKKKPKKKATGGSFYAFRGFAYGGPQGWDYTCSESRMAGDDGVFLAEMKEDDRKIGESLHTVSKGIRDKGHSVTKKKKSDGKVDSMQTLHNLNEDELTGFEENWNNSAAKYLPNWNNSINSFENGGANWIGWDNGAPSWNNWFGYALPPVENYGEISAGGTNGEPEGKNTVRVNID